METTGSTPSKVEGPRVNEEVSTEGRSRKPTSKGLGNSIETSLKQVSAIWKRTVIDIRTCDETQNEVPLQHALSKLSACLKEYEEGWKALVNLFHSDERGEFKELYEKNNDIFLKNMSTAKDAITRASRKLENLHDDTRSLRSHRSRGSSVSRSSITSLRAKASAEAAAARQKLRFAEEIAALKVKRAKEEAEFNAQLEILQAKQEAAETAARVEVLSEIDENSLILEEQCQSTSPNDTSNDHVRRFIESMPTETVPNLETLNRGPEAAGQTPHSTGDTAQIITEAITTALNFKKITAPEPTIFSGNPLQYPDWKLSFDSLIEEHVPSADRIHHLKRYLGGQAKEAVSGYFLLKDPSAYQKARDILEDRYGSPHMVGEAFRTKLDKWPKIDPKNYDDIRRFSDFLTQCSVAMNEMTSLNILNDTREITKLLEKLPGWIANRWKRAAVTAKKANGTYPGLKELADFLKTESDILCDPAMSKTRDCKKQNTCSDPDKSKVSSARSMATNVEKSFCINCERPNHSLSECRKFGAKPYEEKEDFIKRNGLCYGCLKRGHRSRDCQSRAVCDSCKLKHPTSLHKDKPVENSTGPSAPVDTTNRAVDSSNCGSVLSHEMTSMIVPVWISTEEVPSEEFLTYALLDTQSDSTFITTELAGMLRAKPMKSALRLTTMTSERKVIQCEKYTQLQVRRFDTAQRIKLPTTFTRQSIPAHRSHISTDETARLYNHLKPIAKLVPSLQECGFGLLIGYNCSEALAPINHINGEDGQPYAIETKLGWSIVGTHHVKECQEDEIGFSHRVLTSELSPHLQCNNYETSTPHYVMRTRVKELGPGDAIRALERDFSQGESMDHPYSADDQRFLDLQRSSIHVNSDNHIEMPLPFRSKPELPNNRSMAVNRLHHLKKRLMKDDKYYHHYKDFMEDIIRNGEAEIVPQENETDKVCWYIPHHGVYHPNKPDKIRVVFDCSARFQNTSLNDHLLTGPDMTNSLSGVLSRFRQEDIGIMCDIERMFHQFYVNPEDRDYLRFLWWTDGDLDTEPSTYRMKVHLFGAGSSPGCANFGLKYVADLYSEPDQQCAKEFIKRNFYVDDGLKSVDKVSTAIKLINDARSICAKGSLRLHKFISTSREVMGMIPKSEQAKEVKDLDLTSENLPIERALGIQWCIELDSFQFRVVVKDHPLTRRGVLSTVASIFDPLGFLAPFTLKGKQILQQMCREGTNWDEPLSDKLRPKWERWLSELPSLSTIKVSRCYKPKEFGPAKKVELHHFSDASTTGYGQCSYIRLVGKKEVHCMLVMGKSRVTPLKTVTVPRLELQAAVVSTEVSRTLNKDLEYKQIMNHFWTDSQVVMGYISNESKRFHVYVANRVQRIRNTTEPSQWNYVETDVNPADHASGGLYVQELATSDWFNGPAFLLNQRVEYTECPTEIKPDDPEVKSGNVLSVAAEPVIASILDKVDNFSNWGEAVRGITALRRYVLRKRGLDQTSRIEELRKTEILILKQLQHRHFQNEIQRLEQGKPKEKGSLWKLGPYLDQERVLRIGGRLKRSGMSMESKHQIIIPRKSHVTDLLIKHFHEKVAHQGRGFTTNTIRSNGYWIIGLSSAVSSHIYRCITCRKLRGKVQDQRMSDLPERRIEPSPPFAYCGVDCFGPFLIKEGRKEIKKYGLLFTCMSSRAIHVEMLDDLTSDAFINSLRCMMAIRGRIRQIFCDQGTNFVGASNELKRNLALMDDSRIKKFLEAHNCDFIMNAPSSSHMGGVWERQIRSIRNIFTAVLQQHKARLDCSSLRTFLYEAMALVNSRPLTVENINDPNGPNTYYMASQN